jgi:hypothetical protein
MKRIKISPFLDVVEKEYEGVTLRIAPAGNTDSLRKIRQLAKARGDAEVDVDRELQDICEALAGTVLVGWEPFEMGDETIEYSDDNAAALLFHDPQCREFVAQVANDIENFRVKDRQDTLKKS